MRTLRAVGAVFAAATGLDRKQSAKLDLTRRVMALFDFDAEVIGQRVQIVALQRRSYPARELYRTEIRIAHATAWEDPGNFLVKQVEIKV